MVESLLVLARSDAATAEISLVDLQAIAAEAGRIVAAGGRRARRRGDRRRTRPDPGAGPLGALEQILDNLLSNALGVAPPGTAVAVRIVEAAPWIELHVTDQGPACRRACATTPSSASGGPRAQRARVRPRPRHRGTAGTFLRQ